ncbi:transforming acidic coiled-coil-containing protein 2-like [Ochotona princeps]|uniref:transforming acidic coiled-coil-containing protein 2-like n=1 Tax=Ochotona princeps TaxID=9978 RepID=UPI0027148C7D|nr:transforming acidic coiled-coil-containing protein 2-like [Ochotona princeps]
MGNENSTADNQTSSTESPRSFQPPGNMQDTQRKQVDTAQNPGNRDAVSLGPGGLPCTAEDTASSDPCVTSPEAAEPRQRSQQAKEPEVSSLPQERKWPLVPMPFVECPPEDCSARPAVALEDGSLAQLPRRGPSPKAPTDAVTMLASEGDVPAQPHVAATVPEAEKKDPDLEAEGLKTSHCSHAEQLPGNPSVPPGELVEEQLGGESDQAGGLASPGQGDAEIRQGVAGKESSAGQEESPPLQTEAPVPQEAPSDLYNRQVQEMPPCSAESTELLGTYHPLQSNSRAVPQEGCQQQQLGEYLPCTELPWDVPSPSPAAGACGSGLETLDMGMAQGHWQTGMPRPEPEQVVPVASGSQPEGAVPGSTEGSPTEEACGASGLASQPAAQLSAATGGSGSHVGHGMMQLDRKFMLMDCSPL